MTVTIKKVESLIVNERILKELCENAEILNIEEDEIEYLKASLSTGEIISLTEVRSKLEQSREGYIINQNDEEVGYALIIKKGDFLEVDINIYREYRGKGVFKEAFPEILSLQPDEKWVIHVYKFNPAWAGMKRVAERNGFKYSNDPLSMDHKMIRETQGNS
ncbi:hypothetical protein BK131_23625 [Paenibacillus amylolyticus]|uniref:N-acetyltransferase domain-containing protein n=1 Tax=Paenibacillus amylolyticus TaxID=1451 RepID=A0A1R1BLF5_PAEAM|nr:hypothetical protein [Paenibacillus amylolyticus]OMF10608.1 hypothetical protein BK131_23625 [Paenibacillus amylolyticus]